jgi:hypothetical protein
MFARGISMMGGMFIMNAIIVGGNFKEILILMRSWLWKINLNNYFLETLFALLLLLTSSFASFFDFFLGICDHPSFVTQLNIPKTLIVAFKVLSNPSTFLSSPYFCTSFGVPISVDCRVSI